MTHARSLVLALLALAMPGLSQAGWRTFTVRDGLGSNRVYFISEDRSGNLWFGTSHGVTRYDGNWRTFTDANGLAGNAVSSMAEDPAGRLWFGLSYLFPDTYLGPGSGVVCYDGSSWRSYGVADGLPSNHVTQVLADRTGTVWVVCGADAAHPSGAIGRYDPATSTWTTFGQVTASRMMEDHAGGLWFAGQGLSRFDPGTSSWLDVPVPQGYRLDYFTSESPSPSVIESRDGSLWLSGSQFIFVSDDGTPAIFHYDPTASTWEAFSTPGKVRSLLQDRAGSIWVGTEYGAGRFDGSSWQYFAEADGLPSTWGMHGVFEDREGNIWFGTGLGGAARYDGSSWQTFLQVDYGNYVASIAEDRAGDLWVGTRYDGAYRFNGSTWQQHLTVDSTFYFYRVDELTPDRQGNLWFATWGAGAIRWDGSTWRVFDQADGLASGSVGSILEDHSGNLWFATSYPNYSPNPDAGVSRYNPADSTWRVWRAADGLPAPYARSIAEDRDGRIWFAAYGSVGQAVGACRFDPATSTWRIFTTADGLPDILVNHIFKDRDGNLWFGTNGGATRFDGTTWRTYTIGDGLVDDGVNHISQDRAGNLWFSTDGGVTRWDGTTWRSFTEADGLPAHFVWSAYEDRAGNLWFGTVQTQFCGVTRYVPDRVPPHTTFEARPPRLSTSRLQGATFTTLGEPEDIEYSYSADGGAWSEWARAATWSANGLTDGVHVLAVRARDYVCNADSSAATATFEIDATAPAPVISAPLFGLPVRGNVEIRGVAADARFQSFRVETRPAGATSWNPPLVQSSTPVTDGPLATWDTSSLPDGNYDIRLSVSDTLGLSGSVQVTVIVDNHAPFDDQTAPARISAATGGDIYTTNAELHLYFPPRAFRDDVVVTVVPVSPDSVPGALPSRAERVLAGYQAGWGGAALEKPARLEFSYAAVDPLPASGALALYHSTDGTIWRRLGGTVDEGAQRISLAVNEPGRYALFAGGAVPAGEGALTSLSFTPRVFSPTGTFADREVGIAFTLGQASPVTVRVYSRAGWLVREVASGVSLGPGANLVRWDGRDRGAGGMVTDGLYLVTVEALGQTQTKTLAVVR